MFSDFMIVAKRNKSDCFVKKQRNNNDIPNGCTHQACVNYDRIKIVDELSFLISFI